jgi:putative ABC transport system substrate-binding protein
MRRREFLTFLGGAAAWPQSAIGQRADRPRRIGLLLSYVESDPEAQGNIAVVRRRLQELGWTEGRNLQVDYRFAGGDPERLRSSAAELVALAPDVILCGSNPGLAAMLATNRTIPVVFVQVGDPVGSGFIASLARPGGNATGFTNFETSMGGKWLGVLKEAAPNITRVAVLLLPEAAANVAMMRVAASVSSSVRVEIVPTGVHDAAEIERAIAEFARKPNGGLIALPNPVSVNHRVLIADLALRHRLPSMGAFRYMATGGGLISYGINPADLYQRAAAYLNRILRGEKPGDLPVQAPDKFELVINLKTAKALGLTISPTLLGRADEVIE